jgi:hypothetical protein
MMKGRSWNLQGMESIEDSMDPRAKEKHEEEHEDSKKERKTQNNQLLYRESQRLPAWFELTKKQSSRRNGSYDKEQCEKDL